jgi:hypothetical protein
MATLTSAGAVNLTSSTNWSPAQVPVAGDDLIIGAHTLTLDADMVLNTITFNNASSRLAISGTTRSVQATNGWFNTANNTGLISTTLTTGMSVTLTGSWTTTNNTLNNIATSTGGNLTLQTVGASSSAILFNSIIANTGVAFALTSSWTGGTLTTIGRFDFPNFIGGSVFVGMSGGNWSHQSVGLNVFGAGLYRICTLSGTATINWTGSVDSQSFATFAAIFVIGGNSPSHTIGQAGDQFLLSNGSGSSFTAIIYATGGTVECTGTFTGRNEGMVFVAHGGTIRYRNQSLTIPSTDTFLAFFNGSGSIDLSGLVVSNGGKFAVVEYGSGTLTTSSGTSVTNTTSSATACAWGTTALDGKIVNLASDPPTLPAVQDVASGTVYGYAGIEQTGTGLILDPAVLAAAITASQAKSVITGVADTGSSATSIVIKSSSVTPTVTDQWKGRVLLFDNNTLTATLRGQGAPIDGNTTTAITLASGDALTTAPAEDDTFTIV